MRNLKGCGEWDLSLSVTETGLGWACLDESGDLLRAGGQPAWGVRLYPKAQTAEETRLHRSARRRYERRRWRLRLLREQFADAVSAVDPDFFRRLDASGLVDEDGSPLGGVAGSPGLDARALARDFPTAWHLRAWLMRVDEPADVRLVYLALHHIVKRRGNFLMEGSDVSSTRSDLAHACASLEEAVGSWAESDPARASGAPDADAMYFALEDDGLTRRGRARALAPALGLERTSARIVAQAVCGLKADLSKLFDLESSDSFALDDDELADSLADSLDGADADLFDAMREAHAAYMLRGILAGAGKPLGSGAVAGEAGRTISFAMVGAWERYRDDLACLKRLVRAYAPKSYDAFFRGPELACGGYDPKAARGYTLYDLDRTRPYEEFAKDVRRLLAESAAGDAEWEAVEARLSEADFLRRPRGRRNASVPYQLNLEELDAIVEAQGRFHPFLLEAKARLEALVSFRVPYYVGPLTQVSAALDQHGRARFAWAPRLPGQERARVHPWNWDEVIDREAAAERFVGRLTGECTYLVGEPVLPRSSLLYEEFCVLNELAGARWSVDGDVWQRLDARTRQGLLRDLFSRRRRVTYRQAADWICRDRGWSHVEVRGGQGEDAFKSSMPAHLFYSLDVLGRPIPDGLRPAIERAILWATCFEDRAVLRARLMRELGPESAEPAFDARQVDLISRRRMRGWGRLSRASPCRPRTVPCRSWARWQRASPPARGAGARPSWSRSLPTGSSGSAPPSRRSMTPGPRQRARSRSRTSPAPRRSVGPSPRPSPSSTSLRASPGVPRGASSSSARTRPQTSAWPPSRGAVAPPRPWPRSRARSRGFPRTWPVSGATTSVTGACCSGSSRAAGACSRAARLTSRRCEGAGSSTCCPPPS